MPVVTQTRLQTSVFLAACGICSQPQPMVSHGILHSHFGKPGAALLKKGGLEPAANLNSVSAPNGDEDMEVDVVAMGNGKFGYWGDAGWVEIDPDLLRQYSLSFIWFLRWISDSLQISKRVDAKEILSNRVWFIGDAKFDRQTIPVFFARQIQSSQVIGALRQELKAAHKGKAVIILTSASTLDPIDISHDTKIITLPDFLENSEYLKIDRPRIQALLGSPMPTDGFSNGFRTARFNGQDYSFTKKQAAVIEALHEAGKPTHKTEFMSLHSAQDDPKGLFRGAGGKYHAAWDVIIKFDSQGNYWLAT